MGLGLRINKHLPGGHDQLKHGRRGSGSITLYRGVDPTQSPYASEPNRYSDGTPTGGLERSGGWFTDSRWVAQVYAEYWDDEERKFGHVVSVTITQEEAAQYRSIGLGAGNEWFLPEKKVAEAKRIEGKIKVDDRHYNYTPEGFYRYSVGEFTAEKAPSAKELYARTREKFAKHTPGGVDHDQSTHGRKGTGSPKPPTNVRSVERIGDLSTWLKDETGVTKTYIQNIHRGLIYDQTPESYEAKRMYGTIGDQVFMWYQGGDVPEYNDHTPQEVSDLVDQLVVATETPLYTDLTLFRGFGSADMGFKPGDDPATLIGTTVGTGGSFTSTSISPDAAQAFALADVWEGELPVIMKMDAPKGTFGTYLEGETPYPGEYEVLLPPGKSMEITGVTVLEKVGYLDKPVLVLDAKIL